MSHAQGEVYKPDGTLVGYYEYNGTSDVACPKIVKTAQELQAGWRNSNLEWIKCSCGKPPADVVIYSDYGDGFYWPGKACEECKCLIEPLMPYDDDAYDTVKDGHPFPKPEGERDAI